MGRAREGEVFRRVCADLPEPVRVLWARAVELARLSGANSTVEAYEVIAVTFEQAMMEPQSEWRRRATTPDAVFRLACLDRDGWRCRLCNTSRVLQVHHIWSRHVLRDAGREDLLCDPRVGITLCAKCHDSIQSTHAEHVERFLALIGEGGYDALANQP